MFPLKIKLTAVITCKIMKTNPITPKLRRNITCFIKAGLNLKQMLESNDNAIKVVPVKANDRTKDKLRLVPEMKYWKAN